MNSRVSRRHRVVLPMVIVLLVAATARAEPHPLSLTWSVPLECPSERDVRQRIDELLGTSADQVLRTPMGVQAEISRDSKWRLRLSTVEGATTRGTRELVGESCQEVALAAALVIALAIDPEAARRHLDDPGAVAAFADLPPPRIEPGVPKEVEPPPRSPPVRPEPVADEPAPEISRAAVFVAGAAAAGILPGLSLGIGGGAAYELGLARLEGAFFYFPPRLAEADQDGNKGSRLELFAGRLSICYRIEVSPVEPGLCGAVDVGALGAEGRGFLENRETTEVWLALRAGPRVAFRLAEPLALVTRLDGIVPLGRPEFRYVRSDGTRAVIHQPSPIAAAGEIGFEVTIP